MVEVKVKMQVDDSYEPQDEEDEDEKDPSPTPPPERPRLKIKLRLPAHPSTAASTPARTPDVSQPPSRRALSRDLDVESEDDDDTEGRHSRSTPSASVTGANGRPMTTRQAVLASVVDSTHVSLFETSRKKKPLNDAELALRREETARKRRNMSEKKLEDEKAETINRLLKKQSRPKNKRGALSNVEDRTPSTSNAKAASTPVSQSLLREALVHAAAEREGEEDMDIDMNTEMADACPVEALVPEPIPTMYRWVSSTKGFLRAGGTTGDDGAMTLIFSVPVSVTNRIANASPTEEASVLIPQKTPAVCDVEGCTQLRKYRFVKDWTKGACGMSHLKQLEVP